MFFFYYLLFAPDYLRGVSSARLSSSWHECTDSLALVTNSPIAIKVGKDYNVIWVISHTRPNSGLSGFVGKNQGQIVLNSSLLAMVH